MLPEALRLNKRNRDLAQLVEFASHLYGTVAREGFLGDNLGPELETLTALAEGMDRYNKEYKGDFFKPEEPNVKSLSGWKNQRMQDVG